MKPPIYLDYNATTPLDPEVIKAMQPFIREQFGNPSSGHWYGEKPEQAVIEARQQVAKLVSCTAEEIVFTSGGTESNNHAIIGAAQANKERGNHIITTQIEHPAVLEVCRYLDSQGFETTFLPVDNKGMVSVSDVAGAMRPETILITVMHANNEVGTIQPIVEIAELARQSKIVFHTDAAQSLGKIPIDVHKLGVDMLSIAGHKIYAPKGVGALYIKDGIQLEKFYHGAGQENGFRPGTENVIGIVALGKACEIALREIRDNPDHLRNLRDRLYEGITAQVESVRLNGHPEKCLPNTLSVSFYEKEADAILAAISSQVAASAGAACHSDTVQLSHVLEAMKIPVEWAKGTIRFSVGRMTTEAEIDQAVEIIIDAIEKW